MTDPGNEALKELQPCSASSSNSQVTGICCKCGMFIFQVTVELEGGNRASVSENATDPALRLTHCGKNSLDCSKPLVNFQSSEKFDSEFASSLFFFAPICHGLMWDLSSQTRDRTQATVVKVLNPNTWPPEKSFAGFLFTGDVGGDLFWPCLRHAEVPKPVT